jgi:hypothetical protein
MSLKTRLRVSIVVLVIAVVLSLSALNLHSFANARFDDLRERARTTALQVQIMLMQRVSEQVARKPPPKNLEETKRLWAEIVVYDDELAQLLEATMASSSQTVVEILVVGENRSILAASDPSRVGQTARKLPELAELSRRPPWKRLAGLFTERGNYEYTLPLGVEQQEAPVFEIKVVVSSVLLRNALEPQILYLTYLLTASFVAAMALAIVASNIAFRPLAKIGEAIDRLSRGEFREPPPEADSKELAAVQSKLNMLGQQFRGAKEDAIQLRGNIEQLLERLEQAVLLFDRNDRLVMAGRTAGDFLGIGRWELLGRSLDEVFPHSTSVGAAVQGAVQFRRSLKDHRVQLERNGEPDLRLLVNVEMLEDFPSRERLGTLVTLRDAETRRQIGSQLDISTRLAAISRLTGGVAHEIKNPLNAIALHLEVLRSKLADSKAGVEPQIDIITKEITRLNSVVKTFLDFTRPVELRLTALDLAPLAAEVAALVRPEAERNRIAVVLEGESAIVRGDLDLLKQAALNVVMNAVEAMKEGGRLDIRTRRTGDDCILEIADHGAGIPPEVREKIFNLYFTTKGKGSGIGLAMTFRIVQLHNGSIDFASEPGKGTTFWLRIPAVEPEELGSVAAAGTEQEAVT